MQWSDEFIVKQAQKVRQRAFCNAVKQTLLGVAADPLRDQADEVAAAPLGVSGTKGKKPTFLVSEPETFRSWWDGKQSPQLARINARLPEARPWLKDGHLGTSVQRHMEVLVAFSMRTDSAGEISARRIRLDAMREACNQAWAVLTSGSPQSSLALAFTAKRLIGASELPQPTLWYADDRDRTHIARGSVNPYVYDVPSDVRRSYSASDRFGLLRFLLRLAAVQPVDGAWWQTPWVFDVASLALLARASLADRLTPLPGEQLGDLFQPVAVLGRALWDHEVGMWTPMLWEPTLPEFEHAQWTLLLGWLRETYYRELAKLGLQFDDLYPITQPVKVVGAQSITDNVIWA